MNEEEQIQFVVRQAKDSADFRRTAIESLSRPLIDLAHVITGIIGSGGKIMICGNGGSAADSTHMAAEMIVRLTAERNRQPLPAVALTTDSSILTAAGNDFGFDEIFARQVRGLGKMGDMLLMISTSGNSSNLIRAVQAAREQNMVTAALLGGQGGKLAGQVDRKIVIPHSSVQRIQEEQIFLIHLLVELIEGDLCGC